MPEEIKGGYLPQDIESYLFVGGIKDGEWFNVPTASVEYNFPVYKRQRVSFTKDVPENLMWQDEYEERYIKVCINRSRRVNGKALYVFLSKQLYDMNYYDSDVIFDVMCKLVNNYKVIK